MADAGEGQAPVCPGPPAAQRGATRFRVPRGAVDTHAHVIGAPPRYPLVTPRSYTPPPAGAQAYLAILDATSMDYGVLTQISVHGTDNRLLVETLRAHRQRLRGIAVIAPDCSDRERAALDEVRALRARGNMMYRGGGIGFDQIETYGEICREMGWHLQFLIDAGDLPALATRLAKLPVPFLVTFRPRAASIVPASQRCWRWCGTAPGCVCRAPIATARKARTIPTPFSLRKS